MITLRQAVSGDGPRLWALNHLPFIGATADPDVPLVLPLPDQAPSAFPDLADVEESFLAAGGDFVVAELDGLVVGMCGFLPTSSSEVEILRLRVHPALRRRGIARSIMEDLGGRAAKAGFAEVHLNTATNQPEAVAFYRSLGYLETGRETRADWTWTLVYFRKAIGSPTPGDSTPVLVD